MKLRFADAERKSASACVANTTAELDELRALFQRLATNPLSDSDSVRLAILGRMTLLQGEILNKYLGNRH